MKIARFHAESSQIANMVTLLADALTGKAAFTSRSPGAAYRSPEAAVKRGPVDIAPGAGPVGVFEWIDRWFWRQQQRDREAWLSESGDLFELEDRLRVLERRVGGRYY